MKQSTYLTILAAIIQVSCGGGNSTGTEPSAVTSTHSDSELIGTWDGTCRDEVFQSVNNIAEYGADGSYRFLTNYYQNRNCTGITVVDEQVGSFSEGESATLPDGRLITDLNRQLLDQRNFTPQTQLAANDFNSILFCGFDDWQQGVTKNVFGCESGPITALTLDSFDIYHLQDDYFLYFGAGEGLSPQGRPTELRISPVLFRRTEAQNFPAEFSGLWSVLGTGNFFEFRPNNVLYVYTEVTEFTTCYDAGPLHLRSVDSDNYVGFQGVNLNITSDGAFINVRSPEISLDLALVEATDIASQDLLICDP